MTKLRSLADLAIIGVAPSSSPAQSPQTVEDRPQGVDATPTSAPGLGYPIKLSRVRRFEGQPRKYFNRAGLEQLAHSIQKNGQQIPVIVCRGETPGEFVLVDGERRYRAHRLIQEWTGKEPTILANVIVVKSLADHFRRSMIANLQREDLTPLDEAAALHHMRRDTTLAALAEMVGKSKTYVDNYVTVHTLPDKVKELMSPEVPKDRRLSVTAAIDIARATRDDDLRVEMAREVVDRQLSISEVRTLVSTRAGGLLRAGVQGYGYGTGRYRKPSDDYKVFGAFLGRTRSALAKLLDFDFDKIYAHREDDLRDRRQHVQHLRNVLIDLWQLAAKIEGSGVNSPYREADELRVRRLVADFETLLTNICSGDDDPRR